MRLMPLALLSFVFWGCGIGTPCGKASADLRDAKDRLDEIWSSVEKLHEESADKDIHPIFLPEYGRRAHLAESENSDAWKKETLGKGMTYEVWEGMIVGEMGSEWVKNYVATFGEAMDLEPKLEQRIQDIETDMYHLGCEW